MSQAFDDSIDDSTPFLNFDQIHYLFLNFDQIHYLFLKAKSSLRFVRKVVHSQ